MRNPIGMTKAQGLILQRMGLLVLLSAALHWSHTCFSVERSFQGYSFLDGNVIGYRTPSAPVVIPLAALQELYQDRYQAQADENVREWSERICRKARSQDIHDLVYKQPIARIENLYSEALTPIRDRRHYQDDNSFAQYLVRHACLETLGYLAFAKRCEPHVMPPSDPWQKVQRDTLAMKQLIQQAKGRFLDIQSDYIRLRYAYQMIRLAHYAKDYPLVIELYDYLMPKIDYDPSVVEYWIRGHYAGALLALGRNVEATYHYAQVHDRSRGKAETALRSFRIRTDEEWRQCLLLCQSDRERVALYAMRGATSESLALEEMEKIYELIPTSPHLEVLLFKELQKLEKDYLGLYFNDHRDYNKRYFNIPRPNAKNYLAALLAFVARLAEEKQVARPDLWKVAQGYLELLSGNYYMANLNFEQAADLAPGDTLRAQIKVMKLATQIAAWQEATPDVEQQAYSIKLKDPHYEAFEDFTDYLNDKLAHLYRQQNQVGKAFLIQNTLRDLKPNPQLVIIDSLLALCDKPIPTRIERAMIAKSDTSTIRNDLLYMKATLFMAEGNLEAAKEILKAMTPDQLDSYGRFTPFAERIGECVHCRIYDAGASFNKAELIDRLLSMEIRAVTGVPSADTLFYQLGLAWYNMSWFGHSWFVTDFYRSGAGLSLQQRLRTKDYVLPHPVFPLGNRENFDCSRALAYFEKALRLAKNDEFAARTAYMAAKCERNLQDVAAVPTAQRTRQYFKLLRTRYNNTEFYQRIVRECKYFAAYASR